MKKRLLSCLLIVAMLMTVLCISVPVYAKQDFSVSEDFSDYVGTWNGTTVTTEGNLPTFDRGSGYNTGSQTAVSGVTSGVAPNSKYGTSVKVYSAYDEIINSTPGVKYSLAKADYLYHSAYAEISVYVEDPGDNSRAPRNVRVHGKNDTYTSSAQANPVVFSDTKKFTMFGVASTEEWEYDTWYDMKAWMNIDSGEFKVEIWSEGKLVTSATGINSDLANVGEIQTLSFYHGARTNHPTYMKGKAPQTTYFDNMKFESIYKYHNESSIDLSKHAILDFETIDVSSKTAINSYNPKGNFWYGNSGNADGTTLEKVQTDRGYSLRLKPWVLDPEEYEWSYSNVTMEDGTTRKLGDVYDKEGNLLWARNTMLYPQVYFDFHKANHIYDAAYFKTGFKFEDENFGVFTLQVTNYYTPVSVAPNGSITVFGQDSGLDFAIGDWFDIEGTIDLDTGYYTVKLSQEGNSYVYNGSGFVVPVDLTSGGGYTAIYRLRANYTNRAKANDWSMPTSMLLDNMQLGPVSKLKGAVSKNYTFENSGDGDAFTTTGGISVVNNGALNITGKADAETVTSMALPFVKTNFMYSADVTVGDMNADRTLIAQNQTAYNKGRIIEPIEIVKFGSDGKLYIDATEVADVAIGAGAYKVNIIFNQTNASAEVEVLKEGNLVAQSEIELDAAATKILSLDWKVSAGESGTSLDNVSYSTVYDFELIEEQSTHGKDYYFTSADDVIVKFTNAVDRSSFTTDNVKVNRGAIAVTGFEFVDDYTVKIGFDKNQGTHYQIDMTVTDIYGNTISDYVEVNTVRQDLEMTAVSFKKGDKALSLVESGDIDISFTAKANNGTSYDMLFMAGLYNGGKLVASDFDTFTVGEERKPHTLNITVPDDGKLYVLKAFVWDAENGAPYCEAATLKALSEDTKVALVKFDDLNTNNVDKFVKIANWAEENDIKMNFIFMVMYFDPDRVKGSLCDESDIAKLKAMYDSPYIELTSHGYYGGTSFFGVSSLEEQLDDFANVKRTTENMGMTITSMAPPNNAVNADTVKAFNQYPEYKALMVRQNNDSTLNKDGFLNEENGFETFWKYINVEAGGTGNTDTVENLKANWNAAMDKGYDYVMLQAHPGGWADGGEAETNTYEFLLWLKSQGVVFMTATEYAQYVSAY